MNLRCYSKSHECHKASPNFVASTLHMPPLHPPLPNGRGCPLTWLARLSVLQPGGLVQEFSG